MTLSFRTPTLGVRNPLNEDKPPFVPLQPLRDFSLRSASFEMTKYHPNSLTISIQPHKFHQHLPILPFVSPFDVVADDVVFPFRVTAAEGAYSHGIQKNLYSIHYQMQVVLRLVVLFVKSSCI